MLMYVCSSVYLWFICTRSLQAQNIDESGENLHFDDAVCLCRFQFIIIKPKFV